MKEFEDEDETDDEETRFQPGDTVRIDGLKSAAQHNGKLTGIR